MNKKNRLRTESEIGLERDALARRLQEMRRRAVRVIELLKQALEPEALRGVEMEETASEQVARADAAIRTVIALVGRIAAPDALTREQAEAAVERLGGEGLFLEEALQREWEEAGVYGARGLLGALKQLGSALHLYHDRDRCCCNEMVDGERCLCCMAAEALGLGERWLGMLDLPRKPADLPQGCLAWERLWYFSDLDFVHLAAEVQRAAFVHGCSLNPDPGAQDLQARLQAHIVQVIAPFVFRLERIGASADASAFLQAYTAYWILRGHQQGTGSSSAPEQKVHLRVHHRGAPDLDWGTTQSALELGTILPHLLLSIIGDSAFGDLSWTVSGVRYHLTREDGEHHLDLPSPGTTNQVDRGERARVEERATERK